ncbi:MAG: BppU family phage baseplate upper protein [Lachnospiraceae bacterium]|nr:BppU family phage baseplate upper protein [Lachnospiraceae bacterium]
MEINKINDLSFYNDQGILTIAAKQYDTGRKFSFNIVSDDEVIDLTKSRVYLRMLKADGTQFQGEECCTIDGNIIIVDTSISNGEQILSCAGLNKCEIHLTDEAGKSLTTWTFNIEVIPRVHNGDHIDSIDSWDMWDQFEGMICNFELKLDNHIDDKENPHKVTKDQLGLGNVDDKSSETIRSEITKDNVTDALGYTPYTPNEVDNKLSALETNIDWKEAVNSYNDIASTYPEPEDGWTVNVKDTDYTYRYNGEKWVAISANAIPKVTNSVDGLLSKEDYAKFNDKYDKTGGIIRGDVTIYSKGTNEEEIQDFKLRNGRLDLFKQLTGDKTSYVTVTKDDLFRTRNMDFESDILNNFSIKNIYIESTGNTNTNTLFQLSYDSTSLTKQFKGTLKDISEFSAEIDTLKHKGQKINIASISGSTNPVEIFGEHTLAISTDDKYSNRAVVVFERDKIQIGTTDNEKHTYDMLIDPKDTGSHPRIGMRIEQNNNKFTFYKNGIEYELDDIAKKDMLTNKHIYGTCSISSGTVAKTVSITDWKLADGAIAIVKFTYANTASNPTLNINSTGAKAMYYQNSRISGSGIIKANIPYLFVYDGTYFQLVGNTNDGKTVAVQESTPSDTSKVWMW